MNKTKKIAALAVCMTASLAAACAFAACDDEHVHTLTHHEAVAATCTAAGSVEYWECTECEKLFSDAEATTEITETAVAATGHAWADGAVMKVATYTHAGSKEQTCSACDATQTVEVAAIAYEADAVVKAGESIAAAVNAAENGDVIVVKAGTYAEQIVIENKNLTLIGEGEVVVTGPADYAEMKSFAAIGGETTPYVGIVAVKNGDVTIENVTVRGNIAEASAESAITHNNRYIGVAAIDASVTLNYVAVEDITYEDHLVGMQNGIGLYGVAEADNRNIVVRYSEIADFNKGAVVVRASVNELIFDGNTVTGFGEQTAIAQNGIQIACAATITNNTVSDMKYNADNVWAHGSIGLYILTEEADSVVATGNTFDNVDWGIYVGVNGSTTAEDNTFTNLYDAENDYYEEAPVTAE